MTRKSRWGWYAVKLLFESTISGEPNKDKISEDICNDYVLFEEQIVIVKAQSYDHAYKIAHRLAKENEISYDNSYDQIVRWKFIKSIDCYKLLDNTIKTGTEVYSRFLHVPVTQNMEQIMKTYYPEARTNTQGHGSVLGLLHRTLKQTQQGG